MRGGREGCVDVTGGDREPGGDVVAERLVEQRGALTQGGLRVGDRVERLVVRLDRLEAVLGRVAVARDDDRDRLPDPERPSVGDRRQRTRFQLHVDLLLQSGRDLPPRGLGEGADAPGEVGPGDRGHDALDLERRRDVEARDLGMGERAPQHRRVQRARDGDVRREPPGPADESRIFLAAEPLPDPARRHGAHPAASCVSSAA